MTKFNVTSVLAGVATAVALSITVSGNALAAHGSGMGGHGHTDPGPTTVTKTETTKWTNFHDHDRRRFVRFREFGYVGVAGAPYCFYKWTPLGRVRVCPDNY
jgi:hypothetical protein